MPIVAKKRNLFQRSPYVLLESFGIDLHDPNFWHQGLNVIDEMVKEIEELAIKIGVK